MQIGRFENRAYLSLRSPGRVELLVSALWLCATAAAAAQIRAPVHDGGKLETARTSNIASTTASADTTASAATPTSTSNDVAGPLKKRDLLNNPPGFLTWISLVGGAGGVTAFIWRLYEFIVARRDRAADRRTKGNAFWFEKVIFPQILEPLLEFITRHAQRLAALQATAADRTPFRDYYHSTYQPDYATLAARLRLLVIASRPAYDAVINALDHLDERVVVHCFNHDWGGAAINNPAQHTDITLLFSDALNSCLQQLRDLHATFYD